MDTCPWHCGMHTHTRDHRMSFTHNISLTCCGFQCRTVKYHLCQRRHGGIPFCGWRGERKVTFGTAFPYLFLKTGRLWLMVLLFLKDPNGEMIFSTELE